MDEMYVLTCDRMRLRIENWTTIRKTSASDTVCTTNFTRLSWKQTRTSEIRAWRLMRGNILIYIQQDVTLHSLFYLETALHVSGVTTTHRQERQQLYLHHLVFVTPLLLPAASAAGSNNGVTNTRWCRYSCWRSWWWVVVTPETCRAVFR